MAEQRLAGRRAGALVPLFSIPSTESWGIGEIADLPLLARWLRDAGLSALQLLPVNEMGEGQTSPYSALSAMAIDPIFISLRELPEFIAWGGESALDEREAERLSGGVIPAVNVAGVLSRPNAGREHEAVVAPPAARQPGRYDACRQRRPIDHRGRIGP